MHGNVDSFRHDESRPHKKRTNKIRRRANDMMSKVVKYAFRRAGYDIQAYNVQLSEAARFAAMLQYHRVNLVLDVGANKGQFGLDLRKKYAYSGRIVSFEPMRTAYDGLRKAAGKDRTWVLAPRTAIGATHGEVEINIAGNSESSSILQMLDRHADAAPESRYIGVEKVPMSTLDDAASDHITSDSVVFLKVDTQGYEHYVLEGARQILSRAVGMRLELSLVKLYAGQWLMPQMVEFLKGAGFELWGLSPAFVDSRTGRILQVDGMFFRSESSNN